MDLLDSFSPLVLRWNWKTGRWSCRQLNFKQKSYDRSVGVAQYMQDRNRGDEYGRRSLYGWRSLRNRSRKVFELTGPVAHKVCTVPVYWEADYAGWQQGGNRRGHWN